MFLLTMRLDLFLKVSRLMPRRSIAQEFCDAGRITVNGANAKSSKEVKPGDEIKISRRDRSTKVLVTEIPAGKQVSKNAAGDLYQLLEEREIAGDLI